MARPGTPPQPRLALILSFIVTAGVQLEIVTAKRLDHQKLQDIILNADSHEKQADSDAAAATKGAYDPKQGPREHYNPSQDQAREQSTPDAAAEETEEHPEVPKKSLLQDLFPQFLEQVQAVAAQTAAVIQDPELQKAAQNLRDHAHLAAQRVNAAVQDLAKKLLELQEIAQQAMEQAQAAAKNAENNTQDAEMQAKAKEAAQNAMDQVQLAAQSAIATAHHLTSQDLTAPPHRRLKGSPELAERLKELQEIAKQAVEQAQAAAVNAVNNIQDPEIQAKAKEAAQNAMDQAQAQRAAQIAFAAAQDLPEDPELTKNLKEDLQKLSIGNLKKRLFSAGGQMPAGQIEKPDLVAAVLEAERAKASAPKAAAPKQAAPPPKAKDAAQQAMKDAQSLAKQAAAAVVKKTLGDAAENAMHVAQAAADKATEAATNPGVQKMMAEAAKNLAELVKNTARSDAAAKKN